MSLNIARLIAFIALTISAISFAYSVYVTSDWNWRPVTLPLPGPGLEVASPFEIITAGDFELSVDIPAKPQTLAGVGMKELPPIKCKFQLSLEGPDSFKSQKIIESLRFSGGYEYGHINTYSSESLSLPQRGEYTFQLANLGCADPAQFTGGAVGLTRYEHPVENALASDLIRGLAWLTLVIGVICALWSELAKYSAPSSKSRSAITVKSGPGKTGKEERKLWIDAGIAIANNPTARVPCPQCQKEELDVWDQYFTGDSTHLERHMKCPKCGAYNSMRMTRN